MKRRNFLLISFCIVIIGISLFVGSRVGDLKGTDDRIEGSIVEIDRNYRPWFKSIWPSPSEGIERMLFILQGAAGVIYIGYYIGRKKNVQDNNSICKEK